MAILNKIYPIFLMPLLASCEEVFNPDMPQKPVVCINSLITNGDPIDIQVSKSRLYTDSKDDYNVKDADVRIYANGKLQLDSYIPQENDHIKIVAESDTYGRAEADVDIPIPVTNLTTNWETFDVSYGENEGYFGKEVGIEFKLKVELTIEDPAEDNYYKISYFPIPDQEIRPDGMPIRVLTISNLQYKMEPIFSEHIGIFESVYGGDADGFTFFTDKQFAGKSYTLNLQFDTCRFNYNKEEIPECIVHFDIHNISPSYYNWANYIWQRENGMLSDLSDYGLGNQLWGYSNVSTGAGVVAAQSISSCTIDLTDFIKHTIQSSQSETEE